LNAKKKSGKEKEIEKFGSWGVGRLILNFIGDMGERGERWIR